MLFAVLAFASPTFAQSTDFTYQGKLRNAGLPASGLHDFRFTLYDVSSGGVQISPTQCVDNILVTDGVFTATINLGQHFATTAPRFLQVDVRADTGLDCSNLTGFTTLEPRQAITPTPLANHAKAAFTLDAADGSPTAAVVVDNDGKVGIGTTAPDAGGLGTKLDVVGGSVRIENSGDQADLLWFAHDRSWVFRQEGAGTGTSLKLQSIGGGGNKNFIVQTDGAMGVGTTAPLAKLDVRGDIRLGSASELLAPGAVENLRVVRGTVGVLGTVFAGSGWTISHTVTGFYTVTFTTPFSATPTIVASPATAGFSVTQNVSTSSVTFTTRNASGTATDSAIYFIAVGPR